MARPTSTKKRDRTSQGPGRRGETRTTWTDRGPSGDGASQWSRHGTALPGWSDLESGNQYAPDTSAASFLRRVSTFRFAVLVVIVAGAFTLYVGHVHATQNLLSRVQEARAENQRLHLKHNRLQGAMDRKIRPDVIHDRARDLGLEPSTTYGPPVRVE